MNKMVTDQLFRRNREKKNPTENPFYSAHFCRVNDWLYRTITAVIQMDSSMVFVCVVN